MRQFIERHTFWAVVILLLAVIFLWLIFAVWPAWLVEILGRKKTFVNTLLNGLTLGGLYFLVASGFTLIFGLMRNVNLAHGSMYLLGAYIGYEVADASGSWFLGLFVAFFAIAFSGVLMQVLVFRRMEGDNLRQTLVTIAISIIAARHPRADRRRLRLRLDPPRHQRQGPGVLRRPGGHDPMEAIQAGTRYGGEIMGMGNELGMIREGWLADMLLVDGDPLSDVRILQDQRRIIAIMKDGKFHKSPENLSLGMGLGAGMRYTA